MKLKFSFLFFLLSFFAFANDGAFFAKGNQLIPINETEIRVTKEVLTLKKVNNKTIEVTVYYEFFNPNKEKTITVGFEAFAPEGDVEGAPKNGKHPYMNDFLVILNNQKLNYKVAYVQDSLYAESGKIKPINLKTFNGNTAGNNIDFYYVYHFSATFKKGLNVIKHTYNYDVSASIDYNYDFEYMLTPAMRWGNKQIDDFTLIVDPGNFETFNISKTFFKNAADWKINGVGKTEDVTGSEKSFVEEDAVKFHLRSGKLEFKQKNFKPEGDLFIYAQNYYSSESLGYIPFSPYQTRNIVPAENDYERKILKNLPFARRGYIFKDNELNTFYKTLDWYSPDPDYEPNSIGLRPDELEWIKKWK